MNKICLLLFFVGTTICISAQDRESINTDRPDQSEGVYTLGKSFFQIENGITIDKHVVDNFMLRYGLWQGTELRFATDFGKNEADIFFETFAFSAKQRICNQHRLLPAITMVIYETYRPSDKRFLTDMALAFEHSLSEKWSLCYNVASANGLEALFITGQFGFSPNEKISFFTEYYTTISASSSPDHNFDIGAMYALKPNFQIDFALGRSLFNSAPNMYFSVGAGYMFR